MIGFGDGVLLRALVHLHFSSDQTAHSTRFRHIEAQPVRALPSRSNCQPDLGHRVTLLQKKALVECSCGLRAAAIRDIQQERAVRLGSAEAAAHRPRIDQPRGAARRAVNVYY